MATIRISQLTAISAPTDDDILIINDADTNTRKITFANLTQGLLNTSATAQTKSGNLTVGGTLTAANLTVDTDTLFVNGTTNRVGIGTPTPNTDLDVDGNVHIRNQGVLELGDSNDSNFIGLRAPSAITSNFTLTLPSALPVGSSNIMVTDTSGNVTFPADTSYSGGYLNSGGFGVRNAGEVRFYELNTNGGEYISLKAPGNLAGPTDYTLPGTYPGSSGFVLSSDTTGNLSWVSNGAAAAGSAGYVQFNVAGSLGSDSTFTFNDATDTLSVSNVDVGVDLGVAGNLSVDGDVVLGDLNTDGISFNGSVVTDVVPIADSTSDLGTSSLRWAEVHADQYLTDTTVTAGGTTGDQTINKIAGSVNFAAAATSLVVTNNLVTANSVVIATIATNDTTFTSVQAVAGAGSFTLYANAAATAETRVNFLVIN